MDGKDEGGSLKLSGLSIVLPCHNERENLADVFREAAAAGYPCAEAYEIIV